MLPLYKSTAESFDLTDTGIEFSVPLGGARIQARLYSHGDSVYLIRADELFCRDGIYGDSEGEFPDNAERFVFFSRAVLEASLALGFAPHVVHCNDWHTGLVPVYLKTLYADALPSSASLMCIHNIGYQGLFKPSAVRLAGFGPEMFHHPGAFEFYGKFNMLKAGIVYADALGTVSPTYAEEIMTPEHGWGLDGVIRERAADLHGIINGVDYAVYDPSADPAIAARFGPGAMKGKQACREDLERLCGFKRSEHPIACVVSRLSYQKGIDLFIKAAPGFIGRGLRVAVLGAGEAHIEAGLAELAAAYPGRFCFKAGYDEDHARILYAGSDMIVIPSRYEPCGLTQMIAMRYGTVPVARATGGLRDSIEDFDPLNGGGTGFLFNEFAAPALGGALERALCVHADRKRWAGLVSRCMARDFSWDASAARYIALYETLSAGRTA